MKKVAIILSLIISVSAQNQRDKWEMLPLVKGGNARSIVKLGNDYFVGAGSHIFKSDDGLNSFKRIATLPESDGNAGVQLYLTNTDRVLARPQWNYGGL